MPSLAEIFRLSAIPGYWESYILMYGGLTRAAEKLHISRYVLQIAEGAPRGWKPNDRYALELQKALKHVGKRKLSVAERYATLARAGLTPYQLRKVRAYSATEKGRQHFMRQVETYSTKHPVWYIGSMKKWIDEMPPEIRKKLEQTLRGSRRKAAAPGPKRAAPHRKKKSPQRKRQEIIQAMKAKLKYTPTVKLKAFQKRLNASRDPELKGYKRELSKYASELAKSRKKRKRT